MRRGTFFTLEAYRKRIGAQEYASFRHLTDLIRSLDRLIKDEELVNNLISELLDSGQVEFENEKIKLILRIES